MDSIKYDATIISNVETELRRNRKIRSPLAATWKMITDFTKNSTVHGVKYLGEGKRHWSERLFWFLVFLLSVTCCSVLIIQMYGKWKNSPLNFNDKTTPVWEIPFPAVTICPETKVLNKYLNFTKCFKTIMKTQYNKSFNLTNTELLRLEALAHVCELQLLEHEKLNSEIELNEIIPTLQNIAPTMNSTLRHCFWERKLQHCDQIYTQIITEEGSCFTFNILNSTAIYREKSLNLKFLSFIKNKKYSGWSPQERYKITDEETYPRRVGGLEKGSGLKTTLLHNINDTDYICRDQVQGFKIILHNPGIIPRVSKNFIRVPLNMDVTVVVKPNLVTTSKGLRNYHPKHRKCYFEHEKYLKFFKVYTQSNCELECLTNFTLKACNCVKFSMPRIDNMLICNQQQLSCYEKAEINYIKTESFQMSKNKDDKTPETICNCLPSCTSINYNYELTQFDLKFDRNSQIVSSKLSIFFKDGKVATKESLKFYGFNDFVADSGGLLGLFMGISFLSIIEIIYYFSLRLICNLNCRRKFSSTVNPATDDKITKIELIVN